MKKLTEEQVKQSIRSDHIPSLDDVESEEDGTPTISRELYFAMIDYWTSRDNFIDSEKHLNKLAEIK